MDEDHFSDLNVGTDSLSVSYNGIDDSIRYRRGDDPTRLVEQRIADQHLYALAIWTLYVFLVVLGTIALGAFANPIITLAALVGAVAFTFRYPCYLSGNFSGLAHEWAKKLPEKTKSAQGRHGPSTGWR